MLIRGLQFVIGALLAGGGGYLAWTYRSAGMNVFPPEAEMPWLVVAGVLGLCAGVVFLVSAVHPRPKTRALLAAKAARRDETLSAAEAYYSQSESGRASLRDRAADSDWRSGDIPAPAEPVAAPVAEPVKMVEPVRVAAPVAAVAAASVAPVVFAKPAPAPIPPAAAPPAPAPPASTPSASVAKPVATSAPPELAPPPLFPSTATLAPIPAAAEPPPLVAAEKPPASSAIAPVRPQVVEAPVVATAAGAFGAIRAALAAGRLDEAEKLLNAGRETAQGLELAELTGLAGDHAAAAGRASNAKWLWRLALKRFSELGAMDTQAAQAVSESLRVAG